MPAGPASPLLELCVHLFQCFNLHNDGGGGISDGKFPFPIRIIEEPPVAILPAGCSTDAARDSSLALGDPDRPTDIQVQRNIIIHWEHGDVENLKQNLYLDKTNYKGCVYCVDENKGMLDLNKKKIKWKF